MAGISQFLAGGARQERSTRRTSRTEPRGGISSYLGSGQVDDVAGRRRERIQQLEEITEETGLTEEAKKIRERQGEDPDEFWTGGVVSDTFDTLNALQHGVVGILKGQSFKEGIQKRASFTDKDVLGDQGIPGLIAGIALDIIFDPLTYIPPLGVAKAISKARAAGKLTRVDALGKRVSQTQIGRGLGRMFVYRFGQDPVYKRLAERNFQNNARTMENMIELARPLTKLDSAVQRDIGKARKAGKVDELPDELLKKAKPAFDELDRLGQRLVGLGLLKSETYLNNLGRYMARLYRDKEFPGELEKFRSFFDKKSLRTDLSRLKPRKDIPEEVREAMGEILEAGYPTAKALIQISKIVEDATFFKSVATRFARKEGAVGFKQLAETPRLGALSGKFVPEPIFDDINEVIRSKSTLDRTLNKAVTGFKFSKVVMNPATHSRNIISNMILNNFEGMNPIRNADIYALAFREISKRGKWYQEARNKGLSLSTFNAQELTTFINTPAITKLGAAKNRTKNTLNTLSRLYQKEEEWAKMAQYIYQRKRLGKSADEAWKTAERATFNYAQVTPFIRRLRESIFGYPFITFTYKAVPQIARTTVTRPTKISNIGKIKNGIENQIDSPKLEAVRENEAPWVKDGFFIAIPDITDENGGVALFDMTYILPFGDLVSGQFFERRIEQETGQPEGIPETIVRGLAFPAFLAELVENEDFFGNSIFKQTDDVHTQLGDVFRHLLKFYSPPTVSDQIPGGYQADGTRRPGRVEEILAGEKNLTHELLRQVGLKVSPFDIEAQKNYADIRYERALKTLLEEEGVGRQFDIFFRPDDEDTLRGISNF